ncbi:uncharacterized protein LOC123790527 [Ursus americanus]|uniref:uncharacterized protein LOC123790527 n=1 Tax=Ursus americanus TaxID=9643 RepID=UPI001E67AF12|nr:uncharacterized protein LOC123790527 [Ursus americanus]
MSLRPLQEAEQELLARVQSTLGLVARGYSVALLLRGREAETPRLVPQLLQMLFEEALPRGGPDPVLITLSLVQLSHDRRTRDLLSPGTENLSVLDVSPLGLVVENASEVEVSDSRAASELYLQAAGGEGRACSLLTVTMSCPGPDPPEGPGIQGMWRGALRILQLPRALDCPLLQVLAGKVIGEEVEGSLPWIVTRLLEGNNYSGLLLRLDPQGGLEGGWLPELALGCSVRGRGKEDAGETGEAHPVGCGRRGPGPPRWPEEPALRPPWRQPDREWAQPVGQGIARIAEGGTVFQDLPQCGWNAAPVHLPCPLHNYLQLVFTARELGIPELNSHYPGRKGMEFSLLLFSQQVIDSTARHSPGFQGEPEVVGITASLGLGLHQNHPLRDSEEQAWQVPDVALQFFLAQARRKRLHEQHQIWIQEELKHLEQEEEVAGDQVKGLVAGKEACKERQRWSREQKVLRLQLEALQAEQDTAEQDLAALYDLHVQSARARTRHMLQVFRAWRSLWEEQAMTTEHHHRSLLAGVLQDNISLATQNQELQAQNQELQAQNQQLRQGAD